MGMSQGRIKLKQEKVTEARPSQGYAKPRGGANLPDAANREDVAKTNESDIYIPGETRRGLLLLLGRTACRASEALTYAHAHASPSILLSLYDDIKVTKTFVRRR